MAELDDDTDFRGVMDQQAQDWGADELDVDATLEGLEEESEEHAEPEVRRAGTDSVLRRLEASDPEAAELVRGMQQRMSRNINEWNDLRSEVLGLREQLLGRLESSGEPEAAPAEKPLPEGVSQQHLDLFRQMADYFGYVPREEIAARDAEESATSHVQAALKSAVEEFGEDFGTVDESGEVQVNPGVQARLNARLRVLQDPARGITPRDLYLLEFGTQAARRAEPVVAKARPAPPASPRRPAAGVVRRSTGGGQRVRIYDPKRGDSRDDVLDRAWALARRDLVNR